MSEIAVSVRDLAFQIRKKRILSDLHFSIPKGSVFAVVGHNGAGKTTLFHLILGLKFQTHGEISLLGKSNLDYLARENLGYVAERPYLNLDITLRAFLKYHAKLSGYRFQDAENAILVAATSVGLEKNLDQDLETFSKGMLQRALLAQANLGDPSILILDEPMSGLDPEARDSVRERILDWRKNGKTLIFSSHALDDVEKLADFVMILSEGRIQFQGTVSEWRTRK